MVLSHKEMIETQGAFGPWGAYAWYFVPRITFGTSIIAGRILGRRLNQNQINIPAK